MQKQLIFFGILMLCFLSLKSQETRTSQQAIEDMVEEIAQNIEGEVDYSQITSDLYYFLEHPINLNYSDEKTLEKLRSLNDFQILSLVDYIKTQGNMATLYELQLIEGFDYATIKKLLPFVFVSSEKEDEIWSAKKALKYGKSNLFARISSTVETPIGYQKVSDSLFNENPKAYYPGNKYRVYTRYKFSYKTKLQWGITAEKDPGEQFLKGEQKNGFDFYSAHVQINDLGLIKTLVLGDFQAQFGQGLIMWSYLTQGKSSYVMDVRKRSKGLNRYTSTDENSYFRGGGLTLEKRGFTFTAFGSYKSKDANITLSDTLSEQDYFTSFLNTGIHALPVEIENKKSINETVFGGNVNWHHNKFKMGISGIKYQFNLPFVTDDSPENKFRFSGKNNSNLSADIEFRFKALHIFSEAAISESGGKAILAGALMELSSQIRTSVLYRNYQKEYQALYSNAFSEGSKTQNEQGFYMGLEMLPVKKWKIAAYYDFYKFPWITSQADSPSKGADYLVQTDFTVSRTLSMYWRYKREVKQENLEEIESGIPKLSEGAKSYFRYNISYSPGENWELRNRIEMSKYQKEAVEEWGYMLYQDVIYRPEIFPASFVLRYAVFDTETYETRIYTYESDVLNAYSVPPLYGKGVRAYLMLHYQLFEKFDFWLRFAQTWYADRKEIGSGLNRIDGDTKSEIKIQLRYKF